MTVATELLADLRAENERLESEPPEDVVRFLHYRAPDNRAGMDGRPFMAWFFACPDARYIAAYAYQILRLAEETDAPLDQMKVMVRNFLTQPAEFLGYCGFRVLWTNVQRVAATLDYIDRAELIDLIVEIHMYGSHLNAWIHHYYPWGIGYSYQPNTPEYAAGLMTALASQEQAA
jgi:hypothetical protein